MLKWAICRFEFIDLLLVRACDRVAACHCIEGKHSMPDDILALHTDAGLVSHRLSRMLLQRDLQGAEHGHIEGW